MNSSFGIIGGTGKQGTGLAKRLLQLGYSVKIGSRSIERGENHAKELNQLLSTDLCSGGDNEFCSHADVVVLAIPFEQFDQLVLPLAENLNDKIVIDMTVNLSFGKYISAQLTEGEESSYEHIRGKLPGSKVVLSLKTISYVKLDSLDQLNENDFQMTLSDEAYEFTSELVTKFGLKPVRVRGKTHAHTIERMVALSIQLNKEYKGSHIGFRLSDLNIN